MDYISERILYVVCNFQLGKAKDKEGNRKDKPHIVCG